MTVNLLPSRTSNLYLPGDPTRVANRLLQCQIEYRGLLMNQQYMPDRYNITSIEGADADIRDERDINVRDHGETQLDTFYGGRNIVLNGAICAGNMTKLREMERDLQQAFGSLREDILYFRYYDIDERYFDNMNDYLVMDGYNQSSMPSIFSGTFYNTAIGNRRIRHRLRDDYQDVRVQLGVTTGYTITGTSKHIGIFSKGILVGTTPSCILGYWDQATGVLTIATANNDGAGGAYNITALTTSPLVAVLPYTKYYIRMDIIDNEITLQVFQGEYNDWDEPLQTIHYILDGTNDIYGLGKTGNAGIWMDPSDIDFKYNDFKIQALNPSDMYLSCSKIDKIGMKDEFIKNDQYVKPFQIILRAGTPYYRSPTQMGNWSSEQSTVVVTTGNANICNISNKGNFTTKPIIILKGTMTNPIITNNADGKVIKIIGNTGSVAGSKIKIDCFGKTIVDGNGASIINMLDFSSEWFSAQPGFNAYQLDVSGGFSGNPQMAVFWQHGWI